MWDQQSSSSRVPRLAFHCTVCYPLFVHFEHQTVHAFNTLLQYEHSNNQKWCIHQKLTKELICTFVQKLLAEKRWYKTKPRLDVLLVFEGQKTIKNRTQHYLKGRMTKKALDQLETCTKLLLMPDKARDNRSAETCSRVWLGKCASAIVSVYFCWAKARISLYVLQSCRATVVRL